MVKLCMGIVSEPEAVNSDVSLHPCGITPLMDPVSETLHHFMPRFMTDDEPDSTAPPSMRTFITSHGHQSHTFPTSQSRCTLKAASCMCSKYKVASLGVPLRGNGAIDAAETPLKASDCSMIDACSTTSPPHTDLRPQKLFWTLTRGKEVQDGLASWVHRLIHSSSSL